jgi:hypothetical protein
MNQIKIAISKSIAEIQHTYKLPKPVTRVRIPAAALNSDFCCSYQLVTVNLISHLHGVKNKMNLEFK